MRRADRLFRLVQLMRSGKLWTAARLAEEMEVSERTVYRDVADLMASGVPIDGAAGVGYVMRKGFDLPPLMFTEAEVAALAFGARMVAGMGGPDMAEAARDALSKIEAVLPRPGTVDAALDRLRAPPGAMPDNVGRKVDAFDRLVREGRVAQIDYRDESGRPSLRRIEPLALWFWGRDWTLVAWCQLREDFRMFRLDRIAQLDPLDELVPGIPGRTLADCIAQMEAREGRSFPSDPLRR